jgi:hypothetical protein
MLLTILVPTIAATTCDGGRRRMPPDVPSARSRRMTCTSHHRIGRADLADQLWTWAHIARYVHRGRTATFELVSTPAFPAPLSIGGSADRLWLADEVRQSRAPARPQPEHPTAAP